MPTSSPLRDRLVAVTLEWERRFGNAPLTRTALSEPALIGLVLPLTQIHEISWRPLNSFVHGGLHPLQRAGGGFPVQLAKDVLLNSNGMMHMAHRMVARLGSSVQVVGTVDRGYLGFEDCVPMAGGDSQPQHVGVRGK